MGLKKRYPLKPNSPLCHFIFGIPLIPPKQSFFAFIQNTHRTNTKAKEKL